MTRSPPLKLGLRGRVTRVERLDAVQRESLYRILEGHFERVSLERFREDLEEKEWVVLLEQDSGTAVGFTTLMTFELEVAGDPVWIAYSGDTIIAREFWGDREMGRVWLAFLIQLAEFLGDRPTYWFLTSMGHRTYRLMELFFREFYPHRTNETPSPIESILVEAGRLRFADGFDPATKVIRFDPPRECLRPEIRGAPSAREHPTIAFFLNSNPGHGDGEELACIARVDRENLTAFGRRLVSQFEGRPGSTIDFGPGARSSRR